MRRPRKTKSGCTSLGCVLAIGIFILIAIFGAIGSKSASNTPTDTPTTDTTFSQVIPTDTPTPLPTSQPTQPPVVAKAQPTQPSPKPTPTKQHAPQLFLSFTCAEAVDFNFGKVCVHTQPGAGLTITVIYCSGYDATSRSLQGMKYANGSGNSEWDWTPETKCHGSATAYVQASWNGQSTSQSDDFTVY